MEKIHEAATHDPRSYAMMNEAFNKDGRFVICPLVFDGRCLQADKVADNMAQKRIFSTKISSHSLGV